MDWEAIGVGFAFYLIIEGFLPFFSPNSLKQTLIQILAMKESSLRLMGAFSIVLGVALLYAIK